jgi:drug/metabolite transporter (DMT)-like permease
MVASGARNIGLTRSAFGAIIAAILAALLVAVPEAIAKHLIADYSLLQVLWARYAFLLAAMLPCMTAPGCLSRAATTRIDLQLLRVGLQIGCIACFLLALRHMPLGSATALFFVAPLLITVLAIPLLGERPSGHCWMATLLGFVGVIILVAPEAVASKGLFLLPVGAALMLALHQIVMRFLSVTIDSLATLSCGSVLGTLLTSVPLPLVWVDPGLADWACMAAIGLLHGLCQYLWLRALSVLPASVLASFMYLEIPAALAIGLLIFGEPPEAATIVGSLVIVGSGIYSGLRSGQHGVGAEHVRSPSSGPP